MAVKTYFKHSSKQQRYNITIDNKTLHCNTLDDAIETIEKATSMDIDAVFSEGVNFEIFDVKRNDLVATNETITNTALKVNDYESEVMYCVMRGYMEEFE